MPKNNYFLHLLPETGTGEIGRSVFTKKQDLEIGWLDGEITHAWVRCESDLNEADKLVAELNELFHNYEIKFDAIEVPTDWMNTGWTLRWRRYTVEEKIMNLLYPNEKI